MAGVYEHLQIQKEDLTNQRRTRKPGFPYTMREDVAAHTEKIRQSLNSALDQARKQQGVDDGKFILKLAYTGFLDFKNLTKHGVEFVSQENNSLCIVFTSEQGLAQFSEHLAKLGAAADDDLTHKQILHALEGVNNWTREDRESWAIRRHGLPTAEAFILDVELWPYESQDAQVRYEVIAHFEAWLTSKKIKKVDRINRDSLLMYRLEVGQVQAGWLLNHRDVRQVDLPPRTGITFQQIDIPIENLPANLIPPGEAAARICILDSGLTTNHPLLNVAIGESASFLIDQGPEDDVGHGTGVAGIALYGNLEECAAANQWQPELWLFSGKVMQANPENREECIFDVKTIETTIEAAVEYFVERGCRIFNVSLGNENSPYEGGRIGGIAYTLDRLARKHDILFIVSTGNFRGTDTVPHRDWRDEYPDYLFAPESVIIDPAPSINGITVGALANHTASHNEQRYGDRELNELTPASENQPAPFTRHRPSIKYAFKPDLVAHGGNQAVPLRREGGQHRVSHQRLGVLTTHYKPVEHTILKDISGTSFAAPYITHLAGRLLNEYPRASTNLLRALLVNHADTPVECQALLPEGAANDIRDILGYGKVNEDTLFRSTEDEVVLLAEDKINNDSHQFYELPLPKEFLRSKRATRKIQVTLAYMPPVRTTRLEYLASRISFRLVKGHSLEEIERHFNNEKKREVEGISEVSPSNRNITSQERERGTVQSSVWTFRQFNPRYRYYVVVTRQDKDWGALMCEEMERYALVVTVTDRENLESRLYTKVRERLQEKVRVRVQQ